MRSKAKELKIEMKGLSYLFVAALLLGGVVLGLYSPDTLSLLVVGIMAHISIQVVLNIAVVTNTIPNTGISLPFVSYGGTSILFLLSEMGLALSVSRGIKFEVT